MELDLELPSHEQEKLETGSIADDDVMDDTDIIQVEDEDVNSPTTSEPVEEGCRPIACNTITGSGDQVDVNMVGANVVHKGVTCEPKNGLEFESKEAAYSFYREYARSVGFGITIKASRRSKKSGKFIDVKIACSRFGSKRESSTITNPRSCPKTGCKAGMHMKRRQDEKWVIYSFVKEHNHGICPDDFCHAIRGRSKQSGVLACQKKHLQLVLDDGDLENTFLAGMCTPEQSGSITSFFDKYMSRDATFKELIDSYKAFLLDRYEMEAEADSETQNKQPGLRSLSEFEKQMSTIYSDTIFKKFQVEVLGAVSCHLQKESEDGTTVVFRVDDFEERQNFYVA
ncbi:hypothetical protein EZV62_015610 [Acer yangbiense]|uniref:Protein FAR1-RELATED SEQUENCE n=1 Tax=Acer yangbiense TaxID=1000413 RepID=A0A5C7HLA9_9ROSI|nr:hypothetical protein EZV62_015610 [Acer yangbiense]